MWAAGHADDTLGDSDGARAAAGDVDRTPPLMHDGMPITGYHRGEPIPALNALAQEDRLEAPRPLRPTRLARLLTVRGGERALSEERRHT